MEPLLPERLPWFVAGPLIGLLIVAMYALINKPLGVSGACAEVITFVRRRPRAMMWRVWYVVGLLAGGALATWLRGDLAVRLDYGTLGRVVPLPALIPVLFAAGLLMGYGARWAGGCTSGHGLCGTAVLSPGSIAATATFMATAVAVTFILHVVTGGAL